MTYLYVIHRQMLLFHLDTQLGMTVLGHGVGVCLALKEK